MYIIEQLNGCNFTELQNILNKLNTHEKLSIKFMKKIF